MRTMSTTSRHQHGAILFLALIFLLIMSIFGAFGMNASRMENKMAGNDQLQTAALSNAESVLAVAEQKIEAILGSLPFTDWNETGDAYYDRTTESSQTIDAHDANWSFDYLADGSDSGYVIEYAGSELIPGNDASFESTSTCPAGNCVWVFVASARNETSTGAKRTVQSVYVTATPP
jgi:hypothetical protein